MILGLKGLSGFSNDGHTALLDRLVLTTPHEKPIRPTSYKLPKNEGRMVLFTDAKVTPLFTMRHEKVTKRPTQDTVIAKE